MFARLEGQESVRSQQPEAPVLHRIDVRLLVLLSRKTEVLLRCDRTERHIDALPAGEKTGPCLGTDPEGKEGTDSDRTRGKIWGDDGR